MIVKSRTARVALSAVCGVAAVSFVAACGSVSPDGGVQSGSGGGQQAVQAADQSMTPTPYGPLSAADKKLLSLVKETSLREITTSQMAMQRSSNPRIKQAAQMIIGQHIDLMDRDQTAANMVGLQLPDKPSPDMQQGIDRMQTENGQQFEDDYTNTLRQAHGEALVLLSKVRANTQNSVTRQFSDVASQFIKMHIQALEQTGQVDYSKLPIPSPDGK